MVQSKTKLNARLAPINQPFAVVPALDSVLFYFTHQVTSGYSISLEIQQEEPVSFIYAFRRGPLHPNSFFLWSRGPR